MGLISKFAKVKLNSHNIKKFEQLGYELPKKKGVKGKTVAIKGAEIEVKIEDLAPNSEAKVFVECDNCHETQTIKYHYYNRRKYYDGIHFYCHKCTMKLFQSGSNSCHWKPELTYEERNCQRTTADYTEFIKQVYLRDNFTCQCCGKPNDGKLVVHHLDGYNWCKERRTDVSNGITLCENCHQNFHLKYNKGNNTREQFEEWIGRSTKDLGYYNGVLPTTKEVICYETQKIYKSATECSNDMNVTPSSIYACCNHKEGFRTVKSFHYFWKTEYEKMTQDEIKNYIEETQQKIKNHPVICLTTGKRYNSLKEAASDLGTTKTSITESCKYGKAIGRPIKLRWMYIKDFETLSIEEQQNLLVC